MSAQITNKQFKTYAALSNMTIFTKLEPQTRQFEMYYALGGGLVRERNLK